MERWHFPACVTKMVLGYLQETRIKTVVSSQNSVRLRFQQGTGLLASAFLQLSPLAC
jgi:hypothetical protein